MPPFPAPGAFIRDSAPPPNPHPFLAGGLAGASSNDHAAAKLSRQTLMRCAALLASHPCHPSPPPEPFLSPGAGDSSAHGRHLGLKMRLRLPIAAQAGLPRPEARRTPDFLHILQEMDSAAVLVWPLVLCFQCVCVCVSVGLCGGLPCAHTTRVRVRSAFTVTFHRLCMALWDV